MYFFMSCFVRIRNKIGLFLYKYVFKPIFFLFPPEYMHNRFIFVGRVLGSNFVTRKFISFFMNYSNSKLSQKVLGIDFKNPVGLAAGFDKDANMIGIIPECGFGFHEIGSVTAKSYGGNNGTRLWRLKKSDSLIVNYGLKNVGSNVIFKRFGGWKGRFEIPVGINIARTNSKETCDIDVGIKDIVYSYKKFSIKGIGDYFTINISCPNIFGGEPFTVPKNFESLMKEILKVKKIKPILVKLSPDLEKNDLDKILVISKKYGVDGFIISNITKSRKNRRIKEKNLPKVGGISGKAVEELSNNMIKYVYKKTKGDFVIIGCGGIFSGKDAYKKIRLGASLVQLVTGMIYRGPMLMSEINRELVEFMEKDGFKNISEAIGVDNK